MNVKDSALLPQHDDTKGEWCDAGNDRTAGMLSDKLMGTADAAYAIARKPVTPAQAGAHNTYPLPCGISTISMTRLYFAALLRNLQGTANTAWVPASAGSRCEQCEQ